MIYVLYGELEIPRVSVLLLDKNIFPDYTEVFGLFFISNILQESVKYTDIRSSLSSDHSTVLVSLMKMLFHQVEDDYGNQTAPYQNS